MPRLARVGGTRNGIDLAVGLVGKGGDLLLYLLADGLLLLGFGLGFGDFCLGCHLVLVGIVYLVQQEAFVLLFEFLVAQDRLDGGV